jgi:photosystem II stability/assembly factor-like uncharacterized protein
LSGVALWLSFILFVFSSSAQVGPRSVSLRKSASAIEEDNYSKAWQAKLSTIDAIEGNLRLVYFANKRTGWISNNKDLYRTVDGGNSWQKAALDFPGRSTVEKIQCFAPDTCWLLAQHRESWDVLDFRKRYFSLYQTKNGGDSWTVRYQAKGIVINGVSFLTGDEGWIVGANYMADSERPSFFAAVTQDGGKNWNDVSDNLSKLVADSSYSPFTNVYDSLQGVVPTHKGSAQILTLRNLILRTSDFGRRWEANVFSIDVYEHVPFFKFGKDERGLVWAGGSSTGEEGTGVALISEKKKNNWVGFDAGAVYFTDILHISNDHFFACGYLQSLRKENDLNYIKQSGVVLESIDRGGTWKPVFKEPTLESVNSLSRVDGKNIWAVGDNGSIISISRK